MGYPSPGVLTASIDSGIPVKSIWDMISGPGLRLRAADEQLDHERQATRRARRSRSAARAGPRSSTRSWSGSASTRSRCTYVNAGQPVGASRSRAARPTPGLAWEGLRAQWAGQGLKLKYLIGTTFSKQPSNVYSVRADDLSDATKVDLYTRFLQGMIMGLEFAKANPRAAAQITYTSRPALQKSLKPQAGVRLVRRAGRGVRHLAPAGPGLGLALPRPDGPAISTSSTTSGRRRSCSARPTCSRTRSSRRRTRRPTPRRRSPTRRRSS